jgi:hypothetical protein
MDNIWIAILVPVVTAVVPILAGLLGKLIVQLISNSKTQADDRLAAIAVAWAEDYFGKGKGSEKLGQAAQKLSELTKGAITGDQAETQVRAAYQKLMGELSGLKN